MIVVSRSSSARKSETFRTPGSVHSIWPVSFGMQDSAAVIWSYFAGSDRLIRNDVGIASSQSTPSWNTSWPANSFAYCSHVRALSQYSMDPTASSSPDVVWSREIVSGLAGSVR